MKIREVLFFLLSLLCVLLIITFLFPKNGIPIGNKFKLNFVTYDELLEKEVDKANIYDILLKNINIDSLLNANNNKDGDSLILNADELKKTIQPLEFGNEGAESLSSFFEALTTLRTENKLFRVMHYGDSQIECDRISSFLRYKLQNQFGGCGIGLQPIVQPFDYKFSLNVIPSSNWIRYASFGNKTNGVIHKNFGPLASFSRFSPLSNDSTKNDTLLYNASLEVISDNVGYANARKFRQLRMFYSNNKSPVNIIITNGDKVINDTLSITQSLSVKKWIFDDYTSNITIKFSAYDSPDIYGLAFDDTKGIAVDNIALRGNSGTIFTSLNYENLNSFFENVKARLFILQFGGNALPGIKSEDDCKYYAQSILSQIKRLKNIEPNASIIIVGPADKSVKEKNKYVSYKYIEPLIREMKKAAFKGGAAYWDIYKAMGGENSMPVWVNADLAGSDYIHFSTQGASIIANMLYNAIIYEYNRYPKKQILENENLTLN